MRAHRAGGAVEGVRVVAGDNPVGGLCTYLLTLTEGEQADRTVRYLVLHHPGVRRLARLLWP
jgi:hypothetical protein